MELTKKMIQHIQDLHRGFQGVQSEDDAQVQAICDFALSALDREWRPIETAPKDGKVVICMRADDRSLPWGAYWRTYFDGSKGWSNESGDETRPTHWMPLPAPPAKRDECPNEKGTA